MKQTKEILMKDIIPNRYQPRLEFTTDSIEELAQSIQQNGLIQPIVVRETDQGYELIAGERRYRACLYLGHQKIIAIVDDIDDQQSAEMALIENIQRENLTSIEEAKAYRQLMLMNNMTQEAIAKRVGKSQSAVANKIRLLNLEKDIQEAVANRSISERHARALLAVKGPMRSQVYQQILNQNLNVKQTEELVEKVTKGDNHKRKKSIIKGFTKNQRIAINTIAQAVEMVKKVGFEVVMKQEDTAEEMVITILIKK